MDILAGGDETSTQRYLWIEVMIWIAFALSASLLHTGYSHVNAQFKLPGVILNTYRGAIPFLLAVPFLPFIQLPMAWQFYALTALNGLVISFSDTRFFDATARFGSGQILRLKPLVLIFVFIFWLPLDLKQTERLFGNSVLALSVVGTLGVASVSLFFMTRSPMTFEALRFFLPAVLASALIDPVNKLTTYYSHGLAGAFSYAIFSSFFVFVFLLPNMAMRRVSWAEFNNSRYILAGVTIGCISLGFNVAKNLAMAWTPNPAFVTACIFCSALWATLYARVRGVPDEHNLVAGLAFVFSAIALMLFASSF